MSLLVRAIFPVVFVVFALRSESIYKDELSYQDVSWLTSHNSFVYPAAGYFLQQQDFDIDAQLDYGVRSFMLDLHEIPEDWTTYAVSFFSKQNGTVALCHGSCYGEITQTFLDFLITIESFLVKNPQEIITLHLESYIDEPQKILESLKTARLQDRLLTYEQHCELVSASKDYIPQNLHPGIPPISWPTLGQLRKKHKNLIIFIEHQKWRDGRTIDSERQYRNKGLYPVKSHRESRYGIIEDFENACPMRLGEGRDNDRYSPLFLMNRFKNYLLSGRENEINSYENIMKQVENCFRTEKIFPNFIALNFVEKGKNGGGKRAVEQLTKNRKALMKKMSARIVSKSKDTNEEHSEL